MDRLHKDFRFAFRMLLKNPGLSSIIVLTFGLGVGLTTTVFALVNGALYKGLPFPDGNAVLALGRTNPARDIRFQTVPVHDFVDWREQQTTLEDLAAIAMRTVNLAGSEGRAERHTGAFTTANLFDVLRVQPVLGRGFREGDDRPGAQPVIVIGYDIWQDRLAGAPDAIGRTVRANGELRTIVGVAPDGFAFPDREQLWIPEEIDPSASDMELHFKIYYEDQSLADNGKDGADGETLDFYLNNGTAADVTLYIELGGYVGDSYNGDYTISFTETDATKGMIFGD